MNKMWIGILLIMSMILAACASGESGAGDPAKAVEAYLQAKIAGDEAKLKPLLCAEMEKALKREAQSFMGVTDVKIEDMTCKQNAGQDTVTCTGQITATYGTENSVFPLTTYRIVQEGGEWKWCGEA